MKLLTRDELALAFGVHAVTVTKWQRAAMPVAERGGRGVESKYNLGDVVRWRIQTELGRHGVDNLGARTLETERARQARENADRVQLENRLRRGELVEASDTAGMWTKHVTDAKRLIEAIPQAEAERCVDAARLGGPAAVARVLADAVRAVLTALAGA